MPIDPIMLGKLNVASATEDLDLSPEDVSQISAMYDDFDTRTGEYKDYKHRSMLERGYDQNDGMPGEFEYVQPVLMGRTRLAGDRLESEELDVLNENGEIYFVADGSTSRAAEIGDLIKELREALPGFNAHFIDPDADSEGNGTGSKEGNPWDRLSEQRSKGKAGPYEALKRARR